MIRKELNDKKLKKIGGGVFPVIPVAVGGFVVYMGKQAFEHADQIAKGFKKGWNKY